MFPEEFRQAGTNAQPKDELSEKLLYLRDKLLPRSSVATGEHRHWFSGAYGGDRYRLEQCAERIRFEREGVRSGPRRDRATFRRAGKPYAEVPVQIDRFPPDVWDQLVAVESQKLVAFGDRAPFLAVMTADPERLRRRHELVWGRPSPADPKQAERRKAAAGVRAEDRPARPLSAGASSRRSGRFPEPGHDP